MEWLHALSRGKGIRDLVDQAKPRADVGDVGWGREVTDSIKVLCAWSHTAGCNLKSGKLNGVSPEHELVWVQYNPVVSTEVEPFDCLEEALVKVICPKESVVNAFCFVGDVGDNLIKPSGVSIAGCYVPLGCCFVAVSTPGGYEGGEVAIIGVEGDAMVAIPAVKDHLFGVTGY